MPPVDIKVVLLGDMNVGKTCLSERFSNDRFRGLSTGQNTIGAAFVSKQVQIDDKKIWLGIWDTAGSERYNAMTKIYYRGAQAAIVCYDITKANTFAKAKYWIREVRSIEEDCKIYLCGTKKDLYDAGEKATPEIDVVETYADGVQAKFYMTSSKTGENVDELFMDIARHYAPRIKANQNEYDNSRVISLTPTNKTPHCCGSS